MLDIRMIIARKPKKKLCISMATTTDFVHKEVRGGINHAHIIKEVMGTQILSILTNLLLAFLKSILDLGRPRQQPQNCLLAVLSAITGNEGANPF